MRRPHHVVLIAVFALALFASPAAFAKRIALVIGIQDYTAAPKLRNAAADAALIAQTLRAAQFDVTLLQELTIADFPQALRDFAAKANGADVALIYYAGHGVEHLGANYLVPRDANFIDEFALESQGVPLDRLLRTTAGAKARVILLDACRDVPFPDMQSVHGTRSLIRGGLAKVELDRGLEPVRGGPAQSTFIGYATDPGAKASDGSGANSPYALALAKHLATPGTEFAVVYQRVVEAVYQQTQQRPWSNGSVLGELVLVPGTAPANVTTSTAPTVATAEQDYQTGLQLIRERKYSAAIAPLERAVAQGHAAAMSELADLFGSPGVPEDEARSLQLLKRAADLDYPEALWYLAMHYLSNEDGSPMSSRSLAVRDLESAEKVLRRLKSVAPSYSAVVDIFIDDISKSGNSDLPDVAKRRRFLDAVEPLVEQSEFFAAMTLFLLMEDPEQQDRARALPLAQKLADQGNTDGEYYLALCLASADCGVAPDSMRSWALMQSSAAGGHTQANRFAGQILMHGRANWGISKDAYRARAHLMFAADNGDGAAMLLLAQSMLWEPMNSADQEKGLEWLRKAADQKLPDALNLLALSYLEGRYGVGKDSAKGIELLQQAADSSPQGAFNLGENYHVGRYVEKNHRKARELFEKAAKANHPDAQNMLGAMASRGEGGLRLDRDVAKDWFGKAAANGSAEGKANLAQVLMEEKSTDYARIKQLLEEAVEGGASFALIGLADLHFYGLGVVPDRNRAIELLQSANSQGIPGAKERLQSLGMLAK